MKKMVCFDDCVGKTIEAIGNDEGAIAVTFSDGTWSMILANMTEYGCDDSAFISLPTKFNRNDTGASQKVLIGLGVCTKAELDAMYAAEKQAWDQEQEARERSQYERLRTKFSEK